MGKAQLINLSVERTIQAPPEVIYDLVSDVTRVGEWSDECLEAEWIGDASGPAVGAQFKGKNRLGFSRWTTKPTITEAERGKAFAFKVPGKMGPLWRYEFHPTNDGTRVVESAVQDHPTNGFIGFLQRRNGVTDRAAHMAAGMHATLERLDAAATATTTPTTNTAANPA